MSVPLNYRVDHVIKNKFSRPGHKLIRVQAIILHYTANPHANAADHQKYFDGSDGGASRYAGAHIFVDKDEAVEVIPLDEVGYGANEAPLKLSALRATAPYYPGGNANLLTIHIEMCIEPNGAFHPDTVVRTQAVIRKLQKQFPQLADTKNRAVRHYDVTGKNCPAPYVSSPAAWTAFLNGVDKPPKPQPVKNAAETKKDGEELMNIPQWQREELAKIYAHAGKKGVFNKSEEHEKAIKDGTMTKDQAIVLQTIISGAALNGGKRV